MWVMGEGAVADVTTHRATSAMVNEYVRWYDRHFEAEWQDILLTSSKVNGADGSGERRPLAFTPPRTSEDLVRLGKALSAVLALSGGNMTHTPGYGVLILVGLVNVLTDLNHSEEEIEAAERYLESVIESGKFVTLAGAGSVIGTRMREDASQRVAIRLVRESDEGIVVSGKVQMQTATPFAEDLMIACRDDLPQGSGRYRWFIVPVNTPGLRVVARRMAARHENPFLGPLSSRFDELDAMAWLEDVFVPRERVFSAEPLLTNLGKRQSLFSWLLWHHTYGWLAKAELTLGLSLALTEVMGLKGIPQTIEQLVELTVAVQTTRTCLLASEMDPETTAAGHALPNQLHVGAAGINMLRVRQRMTEILRGLPGSSLINAPADTDFADPVMAAELEDAFGGGGYSGLQRAALLQLAWDQVSSGLDGRESAFELHASGGLGVWQRRVWNWFERRNELANGVQGLVDVDVPRMDLSGWEVPRVR